MEYCCVQSYAMLKMLLKMVVSNLAQITLAYPDNDLQRINLHITLIACLLAQITGNTAVLQIPFQRLRSKMTHRSEQNDKRECAAFVYMLSAKDQKDNTTHPGHLTLAESFAYQHEKGYFQGKLMLCWLTTSLFMLGVH